MRALFTSLIVSIGLVLVLTSCRDTELNITNEGSSDSGVTQEADIAGLVTDDMGNPLAGVSVVTLPYARDFELNEIGRKRADLVFTDEQGQYLLEDLPQGSYKLIFLASGKIKVSLAIGPVDFVPDNLVNGVIQKSAVLNPHPDSASMQPVALFDPEDKQRMTELLVSYGIPYTHVVDNVDSIDRDNFNLLVIGFDATVFIDFSQLTDNAPLIDQFLADGGNIYIGQINDFSVEDTPMPFLTGEQRFILHTERAPFNDFFDGTVVDPQHPLVQDVTFANWQYVEAGQQAVKNNVTFDAAVRSSFVGEDWNLVVLTPAQDVVTGEGTVSAESDVIIAEYTDPRSGARIVLNQGAYYQATFGDLTDSNGIRLTNNVVNYIKGLNQ